MWRLVLLGFALAVFATRGAAYAAERVIEVRSEPLAAGVSPDDGSSPATSPVIASDFGRALEMAGEARARGDSVVIELQPGIYRLASPIELNRSHSGSPDAPLVIRVAGGGRATFYGSTRLEAHAASADAPLSPAMAASSPLLQIDLPEDVFLRLQPEQPRGFPLPPRRSPVEFFVGRKRLVSARWPNDGYFIPQVLDNDQRSPELAVPAAQIKHWALERDTLWVGGYWGFDWHYETAPVARLDPGRGAMVLAPLSGPYQIQRQPRFFVYNALSELDAPGEYFLDRPGRRVLYYPPTGAVEPQEVEVPVLEHLLRINDSSDIRFENIGFAYALGDALKIIDAHRVTFSGCFIGHTGSRGAVISGGSGDTLSRCVVTDTGETGVEMTGGDRSTLEPAGHAIDHSIITGFGASLKTYRPAVWIDGVGQVVKNSLIAHGPHVGIWFMGNDHQIIANEFTDTQTETLDSGTIMTGRDWTARGLVISNNIFHNIRAYSSIAFGTPAIYLDDFVSGILIMSNIFCNIDVGVMINGGRDNKVFGNTFFRIAQQPIIVQSLADSKHARLMALPDSVLMKRLNSVPWTGPVWSRQYPELKALHHDQFSPMNTQIKFNWSDKTPLVDVQRSAGPFVSSLDNVSLAQFPPCPPHPLFRVDDLSEAADFAFAAESANNRIPPTVAYNRVPILPFYSELAHAILAPY